LSFGNGTNQLKVYNPAIAVILIGKKLPALQSQLKNLLIYLEGPVSVVLAIGSERMQNCDAGKVHPQIGWCLIWLARFAGMAMSA
jgi:hypothetical protein